MIVIIIVLIGLILGAHLSTLFEEKIHHGPDSEEIKKHVFTISGKNFKLTPRFYACPI